MSETRSLPSAASPAERPEAGEALASLRNESRRERVLDMERRLRPYRALAFAFLGIALLTTGSRLGWWWLVPLAVGLAGFAVVGRFAQRSQRPELWFAAAWAFTPLAIAGGVAVTGGPESPAVMWFCLPAVTLGARFESRGIVVGCAYVVVLLLLSTVAIDPSAAARHYDQLVFAVTLVLGVVALSGALADAERAYRRRSTLDSLTGVLNRSALERRLEEIEGQPERGTTAYLLCDLDHFKDVNDRHGHATGDMVLKETAYVLRRSLRGFDTVYRLGGEEFLAVLPGTDRRGALEVAERMRAALNARRPGGLAITMSVGVAVSHRGSEAVETVGRADAALYTAKAAGRNCVRAA